MAEAGILHLKGGKVRLLKPSELPAGLELATDPSQTAWEMVHQLIRALEAGGEGTAELVAKLGSKAEVARELAYRLYTVCEWKKRAHEALSCNGRPELARDCPTGSPGRARAAQKSLVRCILIPWPTVAIRG